MKKTIILLFAMCIAFSCAAQTFTITQLKGCKWVTYDREKETNTIWFTDPRADGYVATTPVPTDMYQQDKCTG